MKNQLNLFELSGFVVDVKNRKKRIEKVQVKKKKKKLNKVVQRDVKRL